MIKYTNKMENQNQIELLAQASLTGKNYEQAYKYYSQLLEVDTTNKDYWIGKARSAGNLSTIENSKLLEVIMCVKMADQISPFSSEEKKTIAYELVEMAKIKVHNGLNYFDEEVNRKFSAINILPGTLYAVHEMKKLNLYSEVGRHVRPAMIECFDLMDYACQLDGSESNFNVTVALFNTVFEHAKNKMNWFGALNSNAHCLEIWNRAETGLKKINPDKYNPINKDSVSNKEESNSGCIKTILLVVIVILFILMFIGIL